MPAWPRGGIAAIDLPRRRARIGRLAGPQAAVRIGLGPLARAPFPKRRHRLASAQAPPRQDRPEPDQPGDQRPQQHVGPQGWPRQGQVPDGVLQPERLGRGQRAARPPAHVRQRGVADEPVGVGLVDPLGVHAVAGAGPVVERRVERRRAAARRARAAAHGRGTPGSPIWTRTVRWAAPCRQRLRATVPEPGLPVVGSAGGIAIGRPAGYTRGIVRHSPQGRASERGGRGACAGRN
jgi:hypothetical protein